jgi:hypothetical protein
LHLPKNGVIGNLRACPGRVRNLPKSNFPISRDNIFNDTNSDGFDERLATVQVLVKHFEHNSSFVPRFLQLPACKGLDNAHGLIMLLRN